MADTSYAQRLADALGVPVTKASWSHEHKLRAKALAKHLDVSTQAIEKSDVRLCRAHP